MLDNEQNRLLKKIEKTRARAEEIQKIKNNNEKRSKQVLEAR